MQSLIEQVKRLAEAQREADETERLGRMARGASIDAYSRLLMRQRERVCFIATEMDAQAILAHMQAQQAVVDAARKLDLDREDNNDGRAVGHWDASAEDALNAALNAALEKEQSNGKG